MDVDGSIVFPSLDVTQVVYLPELRNVLNFLKKQPFSKSRKKLSKEDFKDIRNGKNVGEYEAELTVSTPVVERVKRLSQKPVKQWQPSSSSSPAPRKLPTHCPHCNGKRFRVVDPGRPDNRRILECARRDCLASIRYSTHQEGTMFGDTLEEGSYGWYLKDPAEIFYPTRVIDKNYTYGRELKTEVLRDDQCRIAIRCPGQKKFVPVM